MSNNDITMANKEYAILYDIYHDKLIFRDAATNQALEFLVGSGYLEMNSVNGNFYITHKGFEYLREHEGPLEDEGEPKPSVFSHADFDKIIEDTIVKIRELSKKKGGEYAGDEDRLANFRRIGNSLGLPMESVWAVHTAKHWDAIMQYIRDQREGKSRDRMEPIEGRVDDLIVYALLFKAMLAERLI